MSAVAEDIRLAVGRDSDSSTPLVERFSSKLQAVIAKAKRAATLPVRPLSFEQAIEEAPQFHDARRAVRLMASLEGSPVRPASSQMLDAVRGGRDLVGYDKAGLAGVIQSIVRAQGPLAYALLVADVLPRKLTCHCKRPCCSGSLTNHVWLNMLGTIAQSAIGVLPPRSKRDYALVWTILARIYGHGPKMTLAQIAEAFSVDQETVSRHHGCLRRWLHGAKANKHETAAEGVISLAWIDAETALRNAGIVG